MSNVSLAIALARRVRLVPALSVLVGALLVTYVGLLAVAMTYGAVQMQSAEAVRDTSAHLATLETTYLAQIAAVNKTNVAAEGFVTPSNADIAYVTSSQTGFAFNAR